MYKRPNIHSNEFQGLVNYCRENRLHIQAAKHHEEACLQGGDYWITEPFSGAVLIASDSLDEIAKFLRVEVK